MFLWGLRSAPCPNTQCYSAEIPQDIVILHKHTLTRTIWCWCCLLKLLVMYRAAFLHCQTSMPDRWQYVQSYIAICHQVCVCERETLKMCLHHIHRNVSVSWRMLSHLGLATPFTALHQYDFIWNGWNWWKDGDESGRVFSWKLWILRGLRWSKMEISGICLVKRRNGMSAESIWWLLWHRKK